MTAIASKNSKASGNSMYGPPLDKREFEEGHRERARTIMAGPTRTHRPPVLSLGTSCRCALRQSLMCDM